MSQARIPSVAAHPDTPALFETKRLSRELIEMDTDSAMTTMFDVISSRLRSDEHRHALQSYLASLRSRRKQPDDTPAR